MLRLQTRDILTFLILLTGAGVSGLLLKDTWNDDDKKAKPELSLAYYLDKAELIGTGEDGAIVYQVWTDRAEQLRDDNSVRLSFVRMVYGPPDGLPWELKANQGSIPADARIIQLQGNVVASSGDDPANRTTIRTQLLEIDPATRQAMTEEKVTIEYNGRILNATGMNADFEKNQLNLLSNVNGKFLP